jgi:uncharacterized protein (DUF952 family)
LLTDHFGFDPSGRVEEHFLGNQDLFLVFDREHEDADVIREIHHAANLFDHLQGVLTRFTLPWLVNEYELDASSAFLLAQAA